MKKSIKVFLCVGLGLALVGGTIGFFALKKLRSAEYAYAQSLKARERGDGDSMLRWMSIAGQRGDVLAQLQLASGFEHGIFGGVKDEKLAADWYLKAAQAGHGVAQFNIATFYWKGRGIEKNQAEAIRWWGEASKNGVLNATNNLAVCYRDGLGIEKDPAKAKGLFIEAATKNFADAQYNLAVMYEREGNRNDALRWYEKAASRGHVLAKKRFESLTGAHL